MAVRECKDCGGKVSKSAKACPHCGAKQPKQVGLLGWIFALVVVLPIAWSVGSGMDGNSNQGQSNATTSSSEPKAKPAEKTESKDPSWDYYSFEDDMTGETVNIASLKSVNSTRFEFPYNKTGGSFLTMSFRKRPGEFDAYFRIDKGQMLCGYSDCKFLLKIGDGRVQTWTGLPSSTHNSDIMFVRDAKDLSQIISRGEEIKIGIDFYKSGTRTFVFDTENYQPPG